MGSHQPGFHSQFASGLVELNLDGIVGPTHNYAGLSRGNVASTASEGRVSSPRQAAKQGLAKAAFLSSLGVAQGFLPPHERPHIPTLRSLGFSGTDADVLARVAKESPILLAQMSSASAMWTANAATIAPSCDTEDQRVHITAANLRSMSHRSIEAPITGRALQAIFANERVFAHHPALLSTDLFGDEGAANHTRLEGQDGKGVHLFAYGKGDGDEGPKRFPARQTVAASQAIARLHALDPKRVVFARQRAESIDAGVFHNDVISVGNGHVLLTHELAFADQGGTIARLRELIPDLVVVTVKASELSLEDAVRTYLFNSQLVSLASGTMAIIAPSESQENAAARAALDRIVADPSNPINAVYVQDLRESMRNGGGPACLRLRVQLARDELATVNPACLYTSALHRSLEQWIDRHYRPQLSPADLADPQLLQQSRAALDELTRILKLGPIYDFQR